MIDVDELLRELGPWFDDPGDDRWGGANLDVPHDHAEFMSGCFRCDLSRDES